MGKKVKRTSASFRLEKPLLWLLFITLLGGVFRFYNPAWDYQKSFHPDERNILGQTPAIQASTGYKVTFFAYGQLPVYLYRATGEILSTPSFFWSLCHGNEGLAKWLYWIFLAALFGAAVWFFSRERWSLYSFGTSAFLLACLVFFKFFKVFSIWFDQLNDFPLKATTFVLALVVSAGFSWWIAEELEMDWFDAPLYSAAGAFFVLGFLPIVLPDSIARLSGLLTFTLLVAGLSLWWAWVSRWGRTILGLFALWGLIASLDHAGRQYNGYGECMIIGRVWSAFFSTSTILAVYFLVKRLYQNVGMALLASASVAFAVVSIEQAHYCITESFITLMFVLVALCSWEILQKGDWNSYLLAGGAFGLSMAAKTSSLYYVFIIATAHLILLSRKSAKDWEREDKKLAGERGLYSVLAGTLLTLLFGIFMFVGWKFKGVIGDLFHYDPKSGLAIWLVLFAFLACLGVVFTVWGIVEFKILRAQMPQWIKLASTGGLAFLLFCLFSPWSLLDFNGFMISQNYEWNTVSIADACYVLQFKDTLRYLYQLKNLVNVELWWPLGLTAVAGMVWVLGRFLTKLFSPTRQGYLLPLPFARGRGFAFSLPDLLILCWFIPYFGFIGGWNTKFVRYMVPLVPAFCIFGARFLTDLIQWTKGFTLARVLKPVLWLLVIGPSLFYSIAYMHVYRFQHPWIESSVWIYKNIPFGSKIFNEAWGDGLPVDLNSSQDPRIDKLMTPGLYRSQDVTPYELHGYPTDDSPIKKNYYANLIPQGDYISISSKKLWYTLTDETPEFRPHGFNIYPVTSRYYRCLWSGLLGYKMVAEFHNFPSFLGWEHPDDMAEESFSVYDHPRVYLFKKVEDVSPERILKLLDSDDYVKGITRDTMRSVTPDTVDSFIAERHQYLESHGLLTQLEASASTANAVAASASTPVVPARPVKPIPAKRGAGKGSTPVVAASAPTVLPTPGIRVDAPATVPGLPNAQTLQALQDLSKNPVIENNIPDSANNPEDGFGYQLRAWFSWVVALILLGWMALPLTLRVLAPFPSGAYSLSKILGFFVFAWVVWFSTSIKLCHFTFASCWIWFVVLVALALFGFWKDNKSIKAAYAKWSKSWMIQEGAFASMFLLFTLIKIYIPHIHDPVGEGYNGGGEAGMDFGFLASIVRGEGFPPQNMWMAGQPIGYTFYYGHLMMGVLTKFLGLVPAVTYNLGLITLFTLIFVGAFGLAYALSGRLLSGWIAGFLCAVAGNPDGAKQLMDAVQQCFATGNLSPLTNHVYDFWGPTRVIPFGNNSGSTINEFPYFSVLYGDLHAHTLAMPFAMLVIGVIGSLFFSTSTQPFRWTHDWLKLLTFGFLLGGVTFLNTWEIPTWLVFLGIAYLVRNCSGINPKIAQLGFRSVLICLLAGLTFLGWFFRSGLARALAPSLKMDISEHALGGTTGCLAFFIVMGLLVAIVLLFVQRSTGILSKQFLTIGLSIAGALAVAGILWVPYFLGFHPQQNKIMWVKPDIRTSLVNYFSVHGFFLCVLLLCFLAAYPKEFQGWISRNMKFKFELDSILENIVNLANRLVLPTSAMEGAMAMGLFSLAVIWGASWVHWIEPTDKAVYSQLLATLAVVPFALAIYFKDKLVFWVVGISAIFLWMVVLILKIIHLFQDMTLTLDLWLFSILWLMAFFHLGLAIKTFRDRSLSFSYLLVSMFFFVTSTLEVFVMSEYFGFGDGMRNNSMFKYGINAWTLASISTGVFLPKIFDFFLAAFKSAKKEGKWPRGVLLAGSSFLIFVLIRCVSDSFLPTWGGITIPVIDVVFVAGFLTWALVEKWIVDSALKILAIMAAVLLILLSVLSMPLVADSGGLWAFVQRWCNGIAVGILFPGVLAVFAVFSAHLFWEGRKDEGRRALLLSWSLLLVVLGLSISVYPVFSTWRKCHGFFDTARKQWVGYVENLTLNGLAYLPRENPYDAAAIRFLNDRIPDQPCLVEFVGEGYNSWGSRFSIFSGVPALMGWDGHVREWLTGRPGMDSDIQQRFQATEQIFKTPDPQIAKKYLDAYGVRLVMVGTLERNGVPGRRGGYPSEGLAKFSGFLPLIYKNPQVEIYYNPPSIQN